MEHPSTGTAQFLLPENCRATGSTSLPPNQALHTKVPSRGLNSLNSSKLIHNSRFNGKHKHDHNLVPRNRVNNYTPRLLSSVAEKSTGVLNHSWFCSYLKTTFPWITVQMTFSSRLQVVPGDESKENLVFLGCLSHMVTERLFFPMKNKQLFLGIQLHLFKIFIYCNFSLNRA